MSDMSAPFFTFEQVAGLALSIQQPWAWLIVRPDVTDVQGRARLYLRNEIKLVENRTWPTRVRGWIDIHAGQKFDIAGYAWVLANFPHIPLPQPSMFERGGIIGRALLDDCVREMGSPWFFGPYGFVFDRSEPVPFRPCRGRLGFFRPEMTAAK